MSRISTKQSEVQIRKWIRTILQEQRQSPEILKEYMNWGFTVTPDEMYDTFIGPFVDVLKVAKVATKDILSSAKLNLDMMFTLSPAKMDQAREKWKARKSKIDQEYQDVMKSTNEALETGDAALLSFMLNPAGFLGVKMAKNVPGAVKGTAQYLEDAGFDSKLAQTWGLTAGSTEPTKPNERGPLAGAVHDLAKLFFITHYAPPGTVMTEAEEEEKKASGDMVENVRDHLESLGILDKIEKDGAALAEDLLEMVEEIMKDVRGKFEALGPLYNATTSEELKAAIAQSKANGFDIGGGGAAALEAELVKSVESMIKDPSSREGLIKAAMDVKGEKVEKGKELPEVSDEDLRPEAEKIVFMQSKTSLQESIFEGVKQMKQTALEALMEDLPPEEDWPIISQSELGKQLIDTLKSAKDEIESA